MKDLRIVKAFGRVALVLVLAALPSLGQMAKRVARQPAEPVAQAQPTPTPETENSGQAGPVKKNGRPTENTTAKASAPATDSPVANSRSSYTYEFSRPEFYVPYIVIKHDENGKGTISFKKKGIDEAQTDPITLSSMTLAKINEALTALNFLNSTESYQYEKDYSHLGNVTFSLRRDGKQRTTKYNWTENKDAKTIADEYRRIGNQYVWQFDMTLARENQPLEAPQLMDALDGYLRRNEISDPRQMLPLLRELSNDERIPLIARNHAGKLAGQIEKSKN